MPTIPPKLTETTTRSEYLAGLKAFDPSGRNAAIAAHVAKLEAMTDAEWPAHRAARIAAASSSARARTVSRLASSIK